MFLQLFWFFSKTNIATAPVSFVCLFAFWKSDIKSSNFLPLIKWTIEEMENLSGKDFFLLFFFPPREVRFYLSETEMDWSI